jgi:hypothetical protein
MMRLILLWCSGIFLLGISSVRAADDVTLLDVQIYGNFHAGGIFAAISGDDNGNAGATLEWRKQGQIAFHPAHPLTLNSISGYFSGSLFWLDPDTIYEVRITLSDPDGVTGPMTAVAELATRPDTLPEPMLRTLYVSPTGSDSNSGTDPDKPLRTIQRAADMSMPGDLILIEPGVYRESVTVPTSGTAEHPIVYRGNGPGVILDGADEAIAAGVSWQDDGAGVYSIITGFATGHVVTDAGRLYQYGSLTDLQTLGAGAPGGFYYNSSEYRLFVKFSDGSHPESFHIHVARRENGFYLDGRSHVRLENLEIRHFGSGSYGKGVYLRYSSDCAVRLCKIHGIQKSGVWLKGGERHLIEDNEIWDTSIFNWPWGYSKSSSAENTAITFTDDIGRGNVIRRNRIYGTFNGIGPCGSSGPPAGMTNETDLYENILYRHTDDAFEPEGYCANVRIWQNYIQDVHMAFAVAPATVGPTYILRNVTYRVGNTRTSQIDGYTASALKINSGYSTPIGPLYLYHNTFYTQSPNTDAVALLNPGESTFIMGRNNLMTGTRYALYKVNPVALDWDWDNLYTTDQSRFVKWEGNPYLDLASFQAATNQELNGLASVPKLADPANGDFRPAADSPLVDRGVVIAGINDNYHGSAPDIGALEYVDGCAFDYDTDGDIDGQDLVEFDGKAEDNLAGFAVEFGRIDCD